MKARKVVAKVIFTGRFFGDDSTSVASSGSGDSLKFGFGSLFVTFNTFLKKFEEAVNDVIKRPAVYIKLVPENLVDTLTSFAATHQPQRNSSSPPKAILEQAKLRSITPPTNYKEPAKRVQPITPPSRTTKLKNNNSLYTLRPAV